MQKKILTIFITLLLFSSCLKQGKAPKIPGVIGPKINLKAGKILLTLELEKIDINAGLTLQIPKLKTSLITLSPRLEGGSIFQISLNPKDIESEYFKVVPDSTLPNGQDFPFLVGGSLPALAINVPKAFDSTFYASNKVFGIATPIKLPIDFNTSIHYRLKINEKNIGIVSLINNIDDDREAFLVVILTMESIVKNPDFKNLLNLSKRYPRSIF